MFEIEKNVPLIAKKAYPLDEMEIGDSFVVPVDGDKKISYVRAQIHNFKKKRPGMEVSTRKEDLGLRVWLVNKGQA